MSDWFVGGLVAQSLEPWHPPGVHTQATMQAAVDFFYNIGALCNIYSHTLSTGLGDAGQLTPEYVTYCANTNLHPRFWSANGVSIYNWWLARSNAQVSVSYSTNGMQSITTFTIKGSQATNTSIELLIPATTSYCGLSVLTNGNVCSTNGYRLANNNDLVRVCVGTSITNVVISYYPLGSPVRVYAENFASVTAPALPSGWTTSSSGVEVNWVTQNTNVDSGPNALYVPDVANIGLSQITSPSISLPGGTSQLTFRNSYNLETGSGGDGYDGGNLEMSIGDGPFVDIVSAGGSFVSGGYNSVIDTGYGSPLAGDPAWSGNSGGFLTTSVNLPASASGTNVQFRWSCGTDNGNKSVGWWLDSISISNWVCACCGSNAPPQLPFQSPQTIPEFATLMVTNTASDPFVSANSLTYNLTQAPATASINSSGIITWSPAQTQSPSTNTFTTVVSDNGSPALFATNSFSVVVTEVNLAPTLGTILPQTISEFSTLTVTNAATESNIHASTSGYKLLVAPTGATINGSGVISWSPTQSQSPSTNTFTTVVTNSDSFDTNNSKLTATNTFSVTVKEVNTAPVLGSILPQTIGEFSTLTVTNAATETNIHSIITGYALTAAPSGATINASGVISWSPTQSQSPSTNTFTTVVTNNDPFDTNNPRLSATNTFSVAVKEVNTAPALGSILPQTIGEFSTLTVTNAATETNIHSTITGYALTEAPAGATISASGVISWSPTQSQSPSTNTFTTVVTNGDSFDTNNPTLTATNTFSVTVKEVNTAPVLGSILPRTIGEFSTLTVTNAATETNIHSTITGYALTVAPAGATINASGVISWSPTQSQSPSTNTFTTVVTNNDPFDTNNPKLAATNSFTVFVQEQNKAPVLPLLSANNVNELTILTITNTATEPNSHATTTGYAITGPSGASIDTNGIITWTPVQTQSPGTNLITTVVTNSDPYDSTNPVLTATNTLMVVVKEVNQAPTLPTISPLTIGEFATLRTTNTATETNIHSVTTGYALVSAPTGAAIDSNGIITWSPSQNQSPGTNTFTTVVTNSNPYDTNNPVLTATNSFSVMVQEMNTPPLLGAFGTQFIGEFATLALTNAATETNIHSSISGYTLTTAPIGATISPSGVVSWSPTQGQSPSTNAFMTVVSNSDPFDSVNPVLLATNSFAVVVQEQNKAPVLPVQMPTNVNELTTLTITNTAGEPNSHALTSGYLVIGPAGVSIDTNGVITWTPAQTQSPSTNLITTVVTNADPYDSVSPALTATNSFSVVVKEVNQAPSLPTISPQTIAEFTSLAITNTASETNIHSVTTGYALPAAPSGATIDTNGVITWSPAQNQSPSTNAFTTVVTNSNLFDTNHPVLTATNTFTVVVREANLAPVLPVQSPANVNELATLVVTNTASEPNVHATTLGYGIIAGPAGVGIDTNGVITWTPAQTQSPGTNIITTIVTNSDPLDSLNSSLTATNSFTVVVNEVNQAPVLASVAPQTIAAQSTLAVTNLATEPNIHSVTVGYTLTSSPSGAAVDTNGVVTWTPGTNQSPSTNTFTVVVTNNNPYDLVNPVLSATNTFSVTVQDVNLAPVLPVQNDVSIDEHVQLVVTNTASEPNFHSVTTGYLLVNAPSGANISSNGVFTWTPGGPQAPSTNVITTVVSNSNPYDPINPVLLATNSFTVFATDPVVSPLMLSIRLTNLVATVTWTTVPGHTYQLRHSGHRWKRLDQRNADGVSKWKPSQHDQLRGDRAEPAVPSGHPARAIPRASLSGQPPKEIRRNGVRCGG